MSKYFTLVCAIFLGQNPLLMAAPKLSSTEFFSKLSAQNMDLVYEFYDPRVTFRDPINELKGAEAVKQYYSDLYKNVDFIKFDFEKQLSSGNDEVLIWVMHLRSKNLNSGKEIIVSGNSHFIFSPESHKCIFHRDYFDMGEFVYEQVPILKYIIRSVKNRLKHKA